MIAAQLEGQGFECFLPKYKSVREWSDRKKEVEQPLFPGYLFCRFDYTQRRPVVVTPGVLQVVGCGRTPTPIETCADALAAVTNNAPNNAMYFR